MDPTGPESQTVNWQFYLNGMGLAGQYGLPPGLVKNDYNTLQPRVGFSEDLFGNGKTVSARRLRNLLRTACRATTSTMPRPTRRLPTTSAGNKSFSSPGFNWGTGQDYRLPGLCRRRNQPSTGLQGAGRSPVQPRRTARNRSVGGHGCAVRRQHGLASEHPAPVQQHACWRDHRQPEHRSSLWPGPAGDPLPLGRYRQPLRRVCQRQGRRTV